MANKITETKNGVTSVLLDVSQTTATEADVAQGKVFTKQDGTQGTGTLVAGGNNPLNVTDDSTMEALLVSENIGKVAQFNGTSSTYTDGEFYLIESAISLISFTIGGTTYQAEKGMIWIRWCDSKYNTEEYYISDTKIYNSEGTGAVSETISTDVIVADKSYSLSHSGGAN